MSAMPKGDTGQADNALFTGIIAIIAGPVLVTTTATIHMPFWQGLLISLTVGVVAGTVTGLVLRWHGRRRKHAHR